MGSLRSLKRNPSEKVNVDRQSNALEKHREVVRRMAALFDCPQQYFLEWPSEEAAEMLQRAEKHGCAKCYWNQDVMCIQSEEEENFPVICSGFRAFSQEERLMFQ